MLDERAGVGCAGTGTAVTVSFSLARPGPSTYLFHPGRLFPTSHAVSACGGQFHAGVRSDPCIASLSVPNADVRGPPAPCGKKTLKHSLTGGKVTESGSLPFR